MALNAPADQPSSGPPRAGLWPGRVLDTFWIAASSPQLTIALAVLLAFTLAVAAFLPQLPHGANPAATSRWLSTTAARYGRFGPFLSSSGLLNLLASPWMLALLTLAAFHLALRVANQARRILGPRRSFPLAPQGLPFELVHMPSPVEDVEPKLAEILRGCKRSTLAAPEPSAVRPRVDAYFERRSWTAAGPLLTYLGPLVILFGLLWNTVGGWRATDVTLIPGRAVQPAEASGLALTLVDPGAADGERPAVVSLTQGAETRHAWLDFARPATWGTVWVAKRDSGPALAVRAAANGGALPLQSLQGEAAPVESLRLRFGQNESEQAFSIPASSLVFRVVNYESLADRGIDRPVFLVEGYLGTDPTPGLTQLVEDAGTLNWQGVVLTLQREAYVVVDLAAIPGLPLLLLGGLVLLAGASITAWGGFTRVWLNAASERDGTVVGVRAAAPVVGQAEVARVASKLAGPARSDTAGGPAGSENARKDSLRLAGYVLVGALLFAGLGVFVLRASGSAAFQVRTWTLVLHGVLAILGLGGLVVASGQSAWFALRGASPADMLDPALPAQAQAMRGRAGDPGRATSLAAFPLLTAGVLSGSVWSLFAFAAPVWPAATEMWLLAAWLLAAAYFHATSGWKPLRAPRWLSAALLVAALVAGIAAALTAASLFSA